MNLHGTPYKHDPSECERIGSRIAIHLAKREYEIATELLERAIATLKTADKSGSRQLSMESPIAELPRISSKLLCLLERNYLAVYVKDLIGLSEEEVSLTRDFGKSLAKELREVLERAGFTFPL